MKNELFENKFAYTNEQLQTIESFYEPLNPKKKNFHSTSEPSYPVDEQIKSTKGIAEIYKITCGKELTIFYLKNSVLLLTDSIQIFINTRKYTFGGNPFFL